MWLQRLRYIYANLMGRLSAATTTDAANAAAAADADLISNMLKKRPTRRRRRRRQHCCLRQRRRRRRIAPRISYLSRRCRTRNVSSSADFEATFTVGGCCVIFFALAKNKVDVPRAARTMRTLILVLGKLAYFITFYHIPLNPLFLENVPY